MYDGWKIIIGLVLGILVLSYPFWPTAGKLGAKIPEPELSAVAKEAKECVEPKSYIKAEHMKLLDEWRNEAIRQGDRIYKSSTGKIYDKSLQNTCLECHSNKTKFCDQCHNFAGVSPICWNCHIEPKEKT